MVVLGPLRLEGLESKLTLKLILNFHCEFQIFDQKMNSAVCSDVVGIQWESVTTN